MKTEPEEIKAIEVTEKPNGFNTLDVIPAYGRDYRTEEQVVAAWKADKDFLINTSDHPHNGQYINLGDAKRFGVTYIRVTFNKRRKSHLIRVD